MKLAHSFRWLGSDAPHGLLPQRRRDASQRLEGGTKRCGVSNYRVTGYGLNEYELL